MTTNAAQKIVPDPTIKLCIVSREKIPPLAIPYGDLRLFTSNKELESVVPPSSDFSMAWASLGEGEKIPPHTHDTTTIIIIYKGSGRLLVEDGREFVEGDCIVIPPFCEAGFVAGPGGCYGISIEVGKR
jgi:hypothetical protein